jgi:AcrR family transcriptional regulator
MPKTSSRLDPSKICTAVLRLAGKKGWSAVTLEAVAREAKLPRAALQKRFAASVDFIPLLVAETTKEAAKATKGVSGTPHDILFDLLMARFDVLQKNRAGVLAIAAQARSDKELATVLARAVIQGIAESAGAVGLSAPHIIVAGGLSAIYAWAFWAWTRDDTRDMAKTMAALDKALRLAGSAAALIKSLHAG